MVQRPKVEAPKNWQNNINLLKSPEGIYCLGIQKTTYIYKNPLKTYTLQVGMYLNIFYICNKSSIS